MTIGRFFGGHCITITATLTSTKASVIASNPATAPDMSVEGVGEWEPEGLHVFGEGGNLPGRKVIVLQPVGLTEVF